MNRTALSRRLFLAGLLAQAGHAAWAEGPPNSFRPRRRGDGAKLATMPGDASALIAAAKLTGDCTYVLADAETGSVLEAHEGTREVPPASTAKVITSLFALDKLGPDYRFATRVLATGPMAGGVVQGDLVLLGGGDPVLQTDMLGDLVARLAGAGLRGVTGRFLLGDEALPRLDQIDPGQPDFVGYNPAISGLNLNFNRVNFEWKREGGDYQVGMDARGERFLPPVTLARMEIADRESPLFTYASAPGQEDWTVARAALGNGGSRWLPVRHPALYTGEVFRTLARAQGIDLPLAELGAAVPGGTELGRQDSEALPTVLKDMLRFSTNLTAEVTGLTTSQAKTLKASAKAMTDWLATQHGVALHMVDHSGLGGESRVTAAAMVDVLIAARHTAGAQGMLPGILRDFGMRDAEGKEAKGSKIKVMAKTGTLNFVSGLVGYILPPQGRPLAFAIYCADPSRRDALPLDQREDPPGGEAWTKRARRLNGQMLNRWSRLYL